MSTKAQTPSSGGKKAKSTAPKEARPDVLMSAFDPLSWWRTLRADQFEKRDLKAIDEVLGKVVLFGRPDWTDAVGDDAAVAVRLAIFLMPIDEIRLDVDVTMTALVRHAIAGDTAAAATISFVLRNLPSRSALHQHIAKSWLVQNVLTAYGSSARSRRPRMELPKPLA